MYVVVLLGRNCRILLAGSRRAEGDQSGASTGDYTATARCPVNKTTQINKFLIKLKAIVFVSKQKTEEYGLQGYQKLAWDQIGILHLSLQIGF